MADPAPALAHQVGIAGEAGPRQVMPNCTARSANGKKFVGDQIDKCDDPSTLQVHLLRPPFPARAPTPMVRCIESVTVLFLPHRIANTMVQCKNKCIESATRADPRGRETPHHLGVVLYEPVYWSWSCGLVGGNSALVGVKLGLVGAVPTRLRQGLPDELGPHGRAVVTHAIPPPTTPTSTRSLPPHLLQPAAVSVPQISETTTACFLRWQGPGFQQRCAGHTAVRARPAGHRAHLQHGAAAGDTHTPRTGARTEVKKRVGRRAAAAGLSPQG